MKKARLLTTTLSLVILTLFGNRGTPAHAQWSYNPSVHQQNFNTQHNLFVARRKRAALQRKQAARAAATKHKKPVKHPAKSGKPIARASAKRSAGH